MGVRPSGSKRRRRYARAKLVQMLRYQQNWAPKSPPVTVCPYKHEYSCGARTTTKLDAARQVALVPSPSYAGVPVSHSPAAHRRKTSSGNLRIASSLQRLLGTTVSSRCKMHTVEDPNRTYLARLNAQTSSGLLSVPGLAFDARAAATSHARASNSALMGVRWAKK